MKKIAAFAEFSFFACVLLWIETKWKFIKKRQRDLYSDFLTEHALSIKVLLYGKNSSLGQKKDDSFILRTGKESQLCL